MELGAFSISLAVTDIEASRRFYEKFGFKVFAGDTTQNWLILNNGEHTIGLFQGMFEKNTLTFNPGWDSNAQIITRKRRRGKWRSSKRRARASRRCRLETQSIPPCPHDAR